MRRHRPKLYHLRRRLGKKNWYNTNSRDYQRKNIYHPEDAVYYYFFPLLNNNYNSCSKSVRKCRRLEELLGCRPRKNVTSYWNNNTHVSRELFRAIRGVWKTRYGATARDVQSQVRNTPSRRPNSGDGNRSDSMKFLSTGWCRRNRCYIKLGGLPYCKGTTVQVGVGSCGICMWSGHRPAAGTRYILLLFLFFFLPIIMRVLFGFFYPWTLRPGTPPRRHRFTLFSSAYLHSSRNRFDLSVLTKQQKSRFIHVPIFTLRTSLPSFFVFSCLIRLSSLKSIAL